MTKSVSTKLAKFTFGVTMAVFASQAWAGIYQQGTVVRMRMVDCLPMHHGFVSMMSGGAAGPVAPDVCPEYTLVSDKVVFVIVGKSSDQLIPLADVVDFRFNKSELALRLDDARHESKFTIKEMILRTDWEMIQKHVKDALENPSRDTSVALRSRE